MNNDDFSHFIDELKAKSTISSVISRYIPLNKKGSSYWACCPFHNEKTASFCVNDAKNNYVCYGCGASGDVYSFVMGLEHCNFMDAVRILADKVGMRVPEYHKDPQAQEKAKKKERLYALMRDAALYYHDQLKTPSADIAMEYIQRRKLSSRTIREFGMGYSPGFNELPAYLLSKGYSRLELIDSGVCDGSVDKLYDAQAGRLIVPIINNLGKVIAFGGRLLEEKDFAKYKNTKETQIFEKKNELFGFTNLKKAKIEGQLKEGVIVVEGYMDVISLCQAGILNVCASMGTALTPQQCRMLKFYSDTIFLCYDGDSAGQKAAIRGIDILRQEGATVKVIRLPDKLDPDDVIKQYGVDNFRELVNSAYAPTEFKLDMLIKQFDMSTPSEQGKFAYDAIKLLDELPSIVEREAYLPLIHSMSGVSMAAIRAEFAKNNNMQPTVQSLDDVTKPRVSAEIVRYNKAARYTLWCLFTNKLQISSQDDLITYLDSPEHIEIYNLVRANANGEEELNIKYLEQLEDNKEAQIILDKDTEYGKITNDKVLNSCINSLKNAYYRMLKNRLAQDIAMESDEDTKLTLMTKMGELINKINSVK